MIKKLAESFSPIARKLEEVAKSTEKLGEMLEKSKPENDKPQFAIENTQPQPQIENNERITYYTALENTLEKLKNNTGFFEAFEDPEHGWMWNGHLIELIGGSELQIKEENNITPGFQNVLVNSSFNTAKSINGKEKVVFQDLLHTIDYYNRPLTKGRESGRDKFF